MNKKVNWKSFGLLVPILALTGLVVSHCKFVADTGQGAGIQVEEFRVIDEVQGWNEKKGGYARYASSSELFLIINGGAELYKSRGMRSGIHQEMERGNENYQILIMDFGSREKAEIMYTEKKQQISDLRAIGNYPDSIAVASGDPLGSAIQAYAMFDQYYFEIRDISGTQEREHLDYANLFIGFYRKRYENLKRQ